MRFERYFHAAMVASLAIAAPLFGQDTTATPSSPAADTAGPLPRGRPAAVFDSVALRRLPIDNVLQVPVLVRGVYSLTDPRAFSIRGALTAETAVYVDGALIRNGQRMDAELLPPLRGTESLAVTTGLVPVHLPQAQAGLLEIVTPTAAGIWTGGVRYRADDAGPDLWRNIGFHRLEATAGGTLPFGFTGVAAFELTGQQSLETEKLRDVQAPIYIVSGTDTVIRQPVDFGNPASDTIDLAIPRFVQYSGYCDESSSGANCHGLQVPFSTRGAHVLQAKIQRVYGTGQHVSLTVLAGRDQAREFPFTALYNSQNRLASRTASRVFVLDWAHRLGAPLSLNVNLSYQRDDRAAGVLSMESEAESREPVGGFLLHPLEFVTDLSTAHDVTIAGTTHRGVKYLDDVQIDCLLAGQAACQDLVPLLDQNQFLSSQPYRMNPYAVEQNQFLPFWTSGMDGPFDLSRERRLLGRVSLGWQSTATNAVYAGLDFARFDTRRYSSQSMISAFAVNAYAERPSQIGAYIMDDARFGGFQLSAGLRIDRFNSNALYPIVPGRISSVTDPYYVTLTNDSIPLAPFDPLNPTENFQRASAHSIVSPHLQAEFEASPQATIRFAIGRQVRAPSFDSLFAYKNTDLSSGNRNLTYGRDLEPATADIIELGGRMEFGSDNNSFADVTLFSQELTGELVGDAGYRDPGAGGQLGHWFVFTTAGRGKVRGIDATLGRRFSSVLTGALSVSHQDRVEGGGTGTFAAVSVGARWKERAPLGQLLANTDVYSIFRIASNREYGLQQNLGQGVTIGQGGASPQFESSARLPVFKTIDLRLTRTFPLGRLGGAVFLESTNLLNWTNLTDIFTETQDVKNDAYQARWIDQQAALLEAEAAQSGLLINVAGAPAVDLRSPGVCTGWSARTGNGAGGPADCVLLQRAEARFGNADGLFTRAEYTSSFNAWYDLANAPYRFYGPGRRVRLGVELSF